jgi:hypothetical protein
MRRYEESISIGVLLPCDYEERDGVAFTHTKGRSHGGPVRVLRTAKVEAEIRAFTRNQQPGWLNFVSGVKKLIDAENQNDPILIRDAHNLMAPFLGFARNENVSEGFKSWLLSSGGTALEDVKLTFWRRRPDKKGNLPPVRLALHCPDIKTAAAAQILLNPEIRVCTHCQKLFRADKPKQQTACSIKCREAHRQARWHARKDSK